MVAGSESSKFRACGSNIYDPNSTGIHNLYFSNTGLENTGMVQITKENSFAFNPVQTTSEVSFGSARFDLSKYNGIFGASDTVHPLSIRGYMLIRYAA